MIGTAVGLFLGFLMVSIAWLRVGKSWPERGDVSSRFFWYSIFLIIFTFLPTIAYLSIKFKNKNELDDLVEVLRWLDLGNDDGLVLTETAKQGYLIPVYTKLRTFYGHKYNTPQYNVRMQKATLFFKQGQYPELLDEVDFLLCSQLPPQLSQEPRLNQFEVVFSSGKWTLMKKTPQPSKPSPPAQSP